MKRLGLALTAPLLLLGLALAGCGGSSDGGDGIASAGTDPTATPSAAATGEPPSDDPNERRLQLTKCLRDNGLEVDDFDPNGGLPEAGKAFATADPEKRDAAFDACRQYAGGADQQAAMSEENKAKTLEYVRCLREQGVDIADPDPETGRPQTKDLQKFINPDEKMKQAMDACGDLRKGLGGGGQTR
jgi:hypothetical protein